MEDLVLGATTLTCMCFFLEFRASVLFMMQEVSWLTCLEPEERDVFMPFSRAVSYQACFPNSDLFAFRHPSELVTPRYNFQALLSNMLFASSAAYGSVSPHMGCSSAFIVVCFQALISTEVLQLLLRYSSHSSGLNLDGCVLADCHLSAHVQLVAAANTSASLLHSYELMKCQTPKCKYWSLESQT